MAVATGNTRELIPWVVRATAAIGAGYALLHVVLPGALGLGLIPALNHALASSSAALMHALGFAVSRSGTLLTWNGASVVVTDDCNSVGAWLLVVGALWAVPSIPWHWRLFGVAGAALSLTLVNVVRIAVLCYLRAARPAWFGPVHEQIFPLVVVLVAGLFVATWFTRVERAIPH